MQLSLLDLGDDAIHQIIDLAPNRVRRQLRCVSRRLRALVDEHLTEVDRMELWAIDTTFLLNWQRFPNIKSLKIDGLRNDAAQALLSTRWNQLTNLDMRAIFDPEGNFFFNDPTLDLSSEPFGALRHLTLSSRDVGPDTLRAIASACPLLESLKIARLNEDGVFSGSINLFKAVAGAGPAALPHLRKLALNDFSLTSSAIKLFDAINWEDLEELDLGMEHYLTNIDIAALFTIAQCPNLKILNLSRIIRGVSDLETLADASLNNLEVVVLSFSPSIVAISGVGAALARCVTQWPKLRDLNIPGLLSDAQELGRFMEVPLPRLESVDLGRLGEGGVAVLRAGAHHWPSLKSLECYFFDLEILDFYTDIPWQLEYLAMGAIAEHVDQLGALPETAPLRSSLRVLRLEGNYNDDSISSSLFDRPWSALEELKLESFYLKAAAVTALSSAPQRGIFPCLRKLALLDCNNDPDDHEDVSFEWYSGLEELDLTFSDLVGTERLPKYAASLQKLKVLWMREKHHSVQTVLRAPWSHTLERIYFDYSTHGYGGISLDTWAKIDAPGWKPVIAYSSSPNKTNVHYFRPKY